MAEKHKIAATCYKVSVPYYWYNSQRNGQENILLFLLLVI